jgi:pilus assembly protein CpaB
MKGRAFLISLVVTALGGVILFLFVKRFESERSGGPLVALLTAKRPIERGHAIVEDDLAVRLVPSSYVEARAVRASDRAAVIDLRAGGAVDTQQTLLWTDLEIASPAHRDLSALLTPGHRAVHVRAMREDQGTALIRPGDYVDVIATFVEGVNGGESRGPEVKASMVLLQKVLVLANGTQTSAIMGDGEKASAFKPEQALTLSLNLQEAQLLSLAAQRGVFSVALRNSDDPRTAELAPDVTAAALLDRVFRPAQIAVRHAAPETTAVRLTVAPPRSSRSTQSR